MRIGFSVVMLALALVSAFIQRNYANLTKSAIPSSCSSFEYYQTASLHTNRELRLGEHLSPEQKSILESAHGEQSSPSGQRWTLIYITNPSQRYFVPQLQTLQSFIREADKDRIALSVIIVIKSLDKSESMAYLVGIYNREFRTETVQDQGNVFGDLPATPFIGSYLVDSSNRVVFDSETLLPCALNEIVGGFIERPSTAPTRDPGNDDVGY